MKKLKEVKTISGKTALKKDCRKIEGNYYFVGDRNIENSGDCYEINDRFYKSNTGYIVYDHFSKQYEIFSSTKHIEGVVNIINKEVLVIGWFTRNKLSVSLVDKDNKTFKVVNYTILENTKYYLQIYTGFYIHQSKLSILDKLNYKEIDYDYKTSLPYNVNKDIINECRLSSNSYKNKLPKYSFSKNLALYLKGLSFGVEFETIAGTIPHKLAKCNSLLSLRDGSISGLEYVTLPLQGEEGINSLINANKLIDNYTTYNDDCSLHLHIGNIPRTEEFILALFKVLTTVEDAFYKMFPLYKRINSGFKRKNYTSPLPSIDILSKLDSKIDSSNIKNNFDVLFTYLSGGNPYDAYNKDLKYVLKHPLDPENNRKWNVKSR